MKKALLIIRWVVGILFIFSGLIKVNDPLGLSFKMQEFFEVWGIPFFNIFSLGMSIIMNMLEVGCGVALIVGFRYKITIRFLLLLIIFFTFLTGYAVLSGKIKTCGCLGDCLPLKAGMSFTKDLVLTALIVLLAVFEKDVKPIFSRVLTSSILMLTLVACVLIQDVVLNYLPYIDCLPFKKGNDILVQMKKPKDYVPDSTVITYQYKKGDKQVEFDQNNFPADFDSTYIFVNRFDKLIRKGTGGAKITDFTLTTISGNDTTMALFGIPKYILVLSNDYRGEKWLKELIDIKNFCDKNNMPIFYVTSQSEEFTSKVTKAGITVLKCDATVIKTAARVNSTYYFMKNSTVFNKYGDRDENKLLATAEQLNKL